MAEGVVRAGRFGGSAREGRALPFVLLTDGGCAQVSRDAPPLRQTSVAALRSTVEVARTAPPLVRQVTPEVGLSPHTQAPSLHVGERVRVKRSVSKPSYEWGSV